jgi:hypothetical protein
VSSFDTMFRHSRLIWLAKTCLLCSFHRVSMVLPVCPVYTLPQSQGMRYMLRTFRSWTQHKLQQHNDTG